MAIKTFYPLTTPAGTNEQTGVGQITVTASGNSREYGHFAAEPRAIFFLDVSAASGTTPSLTVTVQGFDPGSGKWQTVAAFPAQTASTATVIAPIAVDPLYYQVLRTSWVVSGTTPSFTFTCGAITVAEEPIPG